jgi:hypothetical protein
MPRIIFAILLTVTGNFSFAQYVHYSDKTKRADAAPKVVPNTAKEVERDTVRDTVKVVVRDTVRVIVRDTIKVIVRDTVKIVVQDTVKSTPDTVVYHKWPDRCPGLSGAVPVLTNYIPKEMVPKLTEIYKGHLYSISSIKVANNKLEYKLKVCENGEIKFEYADETGNIITKPVSGKN